MPYSVARFFTDKHLTEQTEMTCTLCALPVPVLFLCFPYDQIVITFQKYFTEAEMNTQN